MELTIMSFNLRTDAAEDGANNWSYRIEAAAEAIKASGADVVSTQEGSLAMLKSLHERLPEYDWIGEGRLGGEEGEFCAIFFRKDRLQPVASGTFGLSERPEQLGFQSWNTACPRICTWVRLRQTDGKEWLIYNTHLDHISEEARIKGAALILDRMNLSGGASAIVTGDFNCEPETETILSLNRAGLRHLYADLDASPGCTYHDFEGGEEGEPIDYIFVTPSMRIASANVDRSKYGVRYPSDHYPIVAIVQT